MTVRAISAKKVEIKDSDRRISRVFSSLKAKGEKALIPFITAGDPDIKVTKELIFTLEANGADIIELGIPFSDPMADGPTIQASSERALRSGTTIQDVIDLVAEVRETSEIPIVLFGYYNPIFQYGHKRFAKAAAAAGVDGVLIVDLPAEEAGDLKTELDKAGCDFIFLLTPTSDDGRITVTVNKASGFVYFVSVTGVTGARKAVSRNVEGYVRKIRRFTALPIGVGFGISTPEQASEVAAFADGVVVGSALVNIIASAGSNRDALLKNAGAFISALKAAMERR
ncbi:MAG: tryptophan synthase subunit alpha [Deltaproteobacteria bacterium RIFCSPLOWO2_02_FULL_53_8]|nr:MAG: tryptophan synthase subunit alpha [Deltaproteobacteria bacterium RIFCSPLOWO2_02_FULL_53_8]